MSLAQNVEKKHPLQGVINLFVLACLALLSHALLNQEHTQYTPWMTALFLFCATFLSPNKFGAGTAVFIGLLEDILQGAPLGLHGIGLLAILYLAQQQQHSMGKKPFEIIWLSFFMCFTLTIILLIGLSWLVGTLPSPAGLKHYIATLLALPVVYGLFYLFTRKARR